MINNRSHNADTNLVPTKMEHSIWSRDYHIEFDGTFNTNKEPTLNVQVFKKQYGSTLSDSLINLQFSQADLCMFYLFLIGKLDKFEIVRNQRAINFEWQARKANLPSIFVSVPLVGTRPAAMPVPYPEAVRLSVFVFKRVCDSFGDIPPDVVRCALDATRSLQELIAIDPSPG